MRHGRKVARDPPVGYLSSIDRHRDDVLRFVDDLFRKRVASKAVDQA